MTDHYDRAVDAIQRLPSRLPADEVLMLAQAHAALELANQQRIANLIALASLPNLNGFENEVYDARLTALMDTLLDREEAPAVPGYGPAGIDERIFIRPDIARALRIETP